MKAAKCPDTLPLLSVRYLYGTSAGNLVSHLAAVRAGINSFNPDAAPVQFEEEAEVVRVVARYLEDAQNRLSRAYVKEQKAKGLPDKWQLSIMKPVSHINPIHFLHLHTSFIHAHVRAHTHTHVHARARTRTRVARVCARAHAHAHAHACACACACAHTHHQLLMTIHTPTHHTSTHPGL